MMEVETKETVSGDSGLETHSEDVKWYVRQKRLRGLAILWRKFHPHKRKVLCSENPSILWQAAGSEISNVVKYFLKECEAHVDMPYNRDDDETKEQWIPLGSYHLRTPLLHAIHTNRFENVKVLVDYGANLNATKDIFGHTIEPALHFACSKRSPDKEILHFLLENGANINLRNGSGYTVLHYAVRNASETWVKYLMEIGAICYHDILPYAAMYGYENVFEDLLLNKTDINAPIGVVADAYEIYGAQGFLHHNQDDFQLQWIKAMELRYQDRENPSLKNLPDETKAVFNHQKEPQNMEELESMVHRRDCYLFQSLMIYERVLGENNAEYIFELLQSVDRYHTVDKNLCFEILNYAYSLCLKHDTIFDLVMDVISTMVHQTKKEGDGSIFSIQISINVLEILVDMLDPNVWHIPMKGRRLEKNVLIFHVVPCLQSFLQNYMETIETCTENSDQVPIMKVKSLCRRLAEINPVNMRNQTVLHKALQCRDIFSNCVCAELVKLLIESGFDINWRDDQGNTCIMSLLRSNKLSTDMEYKNPVLDLLLGAGPHEDIRNRQGETYTDLLPLCYSSKTYNALSLQCLCARFIADHSIHHKENFPKSLTVFINMHNRYGIS